MAHDAKRWKYFVEQVAVMNAGDQVAVDAFMEGAKTHMMKKALKNARLQGIAAAVAVAANGDGWSVMVRGKLSSTMCDEAHLIMQRLGVTLKDFKAAGADVADLDIIRQLPCTK